MAFDPAVLACPFPLYEGLRRDAPVQWIEEVGFWLVTRYEDVLALLKDDLTFSNDFNHRFGTGLSFSPSSPARQAVLDRGFEFRPTLFFTDGDAHRRQRNLVQQAFSPRRVRQLEGHVAEIAREVVASLDPADAIDFVADVAGPVPALFIADALGVDRADAQRFKVWADSVVTRLGVPLSEEEDIAHLEHYVEEQQYFAEKIAERRADPKDDLLSDLVHAEIDGDRLSVEELLAIITIIPVAGTETTVGLMGSTMLRVLQDPGLKARVREDPAEFDTLIEEVLRLESPIQSWFRITTRDVEVAGTKIPQGEMVLAVLGSANRDEQRFACPAQLDIDRPNLKEHVAFGRGRHFCLGSSLAKAETRITIDAFLDRFPDAELAVDGEVGYHPNLVHRMPAALPLRVGQSVAAVS